MSLITQFTPTYKLIDKTKNTVVPIEIEGDVTGDLLPFRSSCRISDIIGKAGTYNATLVLRSDDNIFIDHGPILIDEFAKFRYLIDIQFFQPKDIGGPGEDNKGFSTRLFRCEISNSTIDAGRKGHHISLELTAYDVRLEETLDAERHELFTPKESFLDRVVNTATRTTTIAAATGTSVLGTGSPTPTDQVDSVTIIDGSRGYQFPPVVTFSAPTGSPPLVQATGTSVITDGVVTGVIITNKGDGYASPPTVTFDAPPKGPFFVINDFGETSIDLPSNERLRQDWIPTKPTATKKLLDEIIEKVSRPEVIGSANQDFFHFTVADTINPQKFTVVAKQFGEIDSGVILKDEDITSENDTIEKTKQSDFNNRKYKNVIIGRGKAASQTFPANFGRLSSDLSHARFASDFSLFTTYLKGDYVKSGNDRFKSLQNDNTGNTPAASPAFWLNLTTSTDGTPWTIDPELWIASMAGNNLNKITASPGFNEDIDAIVSGGAVTGFRINDGGTGHSLGDTLTFLGTGINAVGTVDGVSSGVITSLDITDGGEGWVVGFFTDMNIARGNYDREDEFNEFEKVSVKDIESFQFSTPDDIPNGEIATGRRWLVNGGTGDWAGQNQRIAQREGAQWRFSNFPVGAASSSIPRDIVNDLNLARILGFNGVNWETIWSITVNTGNSSPFHPVETVEKVSNRNNLNQAVEFTFNWNTFTLANIGQFILDAINISLPIGVPLRIFGIALADLETNSVTEFLSFIGKTEEELLALFGSGNDKNTASRCLMWNLKFPFPRNKITTSVKTYNVGDLIKRPIVDFENLSETIDKNLRGWNNGLDTENLGNIRGLEWWQKTSFFNKAGDPIDGKADIPFLLFFRDKFDTLVYKEITQRSHNRWGKFRTAAGPNANMKIFDSRIDELFTALGFTFPDNFFLEQRELTGLKFDWRRVKEIFCVYKESYDDNLFYKAGQLPFLDNFGEHATQYFKDQLVRFTFGFLDEENVVVDKAKIAVDDFHFIKDAYVSSSDEAEPDSRIESVDLQNQFDYINMKKTLLPRLLSRRQFHPEFQLTDCIGNVRLRAGQSYTLDDSTVLSPTKLTPIEVTHIDDGNGYNCQMTSLRKYEVPS